MVQYVIAGLVLGGIYALAAGGLVITYVSSGILNFAFGALAFLIARIYYWLHVEQGWEILPAAVLSILVLAPALGLFLYAALFRLVRLAPSLIKVVVTIGLSVTIPPLSNIIFGETEIIRAPGLAPEPVRVYRVFDTPVTMDQLITYACVVAILVGGFLILRYTDAGLRVRALVDSEAMTSLSGANPSVVSMGVWMVSTFLAGLAGVLAAPVIGLNAGDYTLLIAAAFAAVIAGKLRSLPIAIGVALLMGITGSLVQYFMPETSELTAAIIPSIPFGFIVVFLVYHMLRSGKVSETEGVGGALDRAITPHSESKLATSADERSLDNPFPRVRLLGPVAVFGLIALLPLILSDYWLGLMGGAAALAIALLSLTLVIGEGGMLWLSEITFAGVGALATAQLATVHGWPLLPAVLIAGLIAGAMGVVVGIATIRLGDLYVALVTLTFGLLMERLVFTRNTFYQFGIGVAVDRPGFAVDDLAFTYLALGVFALFALLIVNLRRSTTGLALSAVRWSETASRTLGVSVVQMKVLAAALAAFIAGIGGAFIAMHAGQAQPDSYSVLLGMVWLAVVVTFAVRSNLAALLAAMAFTFFPALFLTYLTPTWSRLPPALFGLGAIAVAQNPDGTVTMYARAFQRLLVRIGRRRFLADQAPVAGELEPQPASADLASGRSDLAEMPKR